MSGMEGVKEQEQVDGSSMPPSKEEVLIYLNMFNADLVSNAQVAFLPIQRFLLLQQFVSVCFVQEEVVKKKYGGIMPKKPPLISKVIF